MMKPNVSIGLRLFACLLALTLLPLLSLTATASNEFVPDTEYVIDEVEVEHLFTVENYYEGHVVQGVAVHNGIVFQLHDGGRCSTYQLDTGELLGQFHLGSFYTHNHCGNGNFGWIYPEGNTQFPALYVSGDLTTKACYVENVTTTSAELIQTIYFDVEPSTYTGGQVILDRERNCIVYMQREKKNIGDHSNVYRMFEFPIPALDAGKEIHFTNADMLCDPYVLPFYPGIYQGACIYGNTILQTHGFSSTPTEYGAKVGMVCYDTVTHDFTRAFDLTGIIDVEPQGTFVYNGELYMNFVNGKFYKITPKPAVRTDGYDMICVENEEQLLANLADMIPAPFRWKNVDVESLDWNTQTGGFSVNVTLQTPYNDMRVTLTGHALQHPWGEYHSNGDATCTADGTQTRVCTYDGCGKNETIPDPASATGHDFGEWQVTEKATPFANGLMESACSRCDATQTVVLNAYGLGTTEITVIAVAASVTLLATALAVVLLILIRKKK